MSTGYKRKSLHCCISHRVRAVKEVDSKSTGLCPRRFESCRCGFLFSRTRKFPLLLLTTKVVFSLAVQIDKSFMFHITLAF